MAEESSVFHKGELEIQTRMGVRARIEAFARKVVRDHMPEEHRRFYAQLPSLVVGTLDAADRQPWASVLFGQPGFLSTPSEGQLRVDARPLPGSPLSEGLQMGAPIGVLGIEPDTRRRNRLTGTVCAIDERGFSIKVLQTFGNCPQYIQRRRPEGRLIEGHPRFEHYERLRPADATGISAADTLFIATWYGEPTSTSVGTTDPRQGADVSHRGGQPGFVRIEDERTFIFPDFAGNLHYNTIGNLLLHPKVGVTFVDYEQGSLLYVGGTAEIIQEGDPLLETFVGAERFVRVRIAQLIRTERVLPRAWIFVEASPMNALTGTWHRAETALKERAEQQTWRPVEVVRTERESAVITSFFLRRLDGEPWGPHLPGQFLPIRVQLPGSAETMTRTYTVSDAARADAVRISVKREAKGRVSAFLHDHLTAGHTLEAQSPRGSFFLDESHRRPVCLLSGGVGVTPMVAMVNHIVEVGRLTRFFRRTYFIHGAANGRVQAFKSHIRDLGERHDWLTCHFRYAHPEPGDTDVDDTSQGWVDIPLLKRLLHWDDYDFYLCGPPPFMKSLFSGLRESGVPRHRIFFESFGPATILEEAEVIPQRVPVDVRFEGYGDAVRWTPESGSLLDLAEAHGVPIPSSCRTGVCGTCMSKINCGEVEYLKAPTAPIADAHALLCCSVPKSSSSGCGEAVGLVVKV